MDSRDIQRHLAQLSKCIKKSTINRYSDQRKVKYQEKLIELYSLISKEDFSKLPATDISSLKTIIDFIFHNIQFLDNSTLTISPFEIVYCLEKVLDEWIPDNKFIIATSLSNNLNEFSFNGYLALHTPIYDLIKNKYNIEFEYKLIQITLPRYFVHDYLANVVLYHELGHFIDNYFIVSRTIVYNQIASGKFIPKSQLEINSSISYYMEYFADIFAAQYIANSSNHFLNYIAHNHPDSTSHPSTAKRIQMVNEFLKSNFAESTISILKAETVNRTKMDLINRHVVLKTDDFEGLIPMEINNVTELHSVFLAGWNFWKANPNKIIDQFGVDKSYKIINNLIEKSISNFVVIDSWNK
ncbi:MAG: hypothetical protein ACXVP0_00505 [Bacteroidia bacterium]